MSRYWMTPEEIQKKKARNKMLLYVSFFTATILISAIVTLLANQI
jgi:hypothetical protein